MDLQVKNRTILGKKVRSLRKEGLIPGEIFGHGTPNKHVEVQEKDFVKLYKKAGEHTIITALTEDGEKIPVLISNIERHPLSGQLLNIDFHQIRMDEKIQTKIPIIFTGVAPAVKNDLVVVKVMEEIEIESLPDKIPHQFEVDLGSLESVGQSIHVSDLTPPQEVKILSSENMVVVTITEKTKEEVAPTPAVTTEEAPTETQTPENKEETPQTPNQ